MAQHLPTLQRLEQKTVLLLLVSCRPKSENSPREPGTDTTHKTSPTFRASLNQTQNLSHVAFQAGKERITTRLNKCAEHRVDVRRTGGGVVWAGRQRFHKKFHFQPGNYMFAEIPVCASSETCEQSVRGNEAYLFGRSEPLRLDQLKNTKIFCMLVNATNTSDSFTQKQTQTRG